MWAERLSAIPGEPDPLERVECATVAHTQHVRDRKRAGRRGDQKSVVTRGLIPLLGIKPVIVLETARQRGYIPKDDRDDGA